MGTDVPGEYAGDQRDVGVVTVVVSVEVESARGRLEMNESNLVAPLKPGGESIGGATDGKLIVIAIGAPNCAELVRDRYGEVDDCGDRGPPPRAAEIEGNVCADPGEPAVEGEGAYRSGARVASDNGVLASKENCDGVGEPATGAVSGGDGWSTFIDSGLVTVLVGRKGPGLSLIFLALDGCV